MGTILGIIKQEEFFLHYFKINISLPTNCIFIIFYTAITVTETPNFYKTKNRFFHTEMKRTSIFILITISLLNQLLTFLLSYNDSFSKLNFIKNIVSWNIFCLHILILAYVHPANLVNYKSFSNKSKISEISYEYNL